MSVIVVVYNGVLWETLAQALIFVIIITLKISGFSKFNLFKVLLSYSGFL